MSSPNNFMELCRLCLVKEKVSIPIFEGEGDARQICVKIAACLPVKVEKNDQLPKKICDSCLYKVENVYQFWNTTADSEKQLRQWLGEAKKVEGTPPEATALETGQLTLKVEAPDPEHNTSANQSDPLTKKSEGEDSLSEDDDDDDAISIDDDTEGPGKEEAESEEDGFGELEPTTFVNVSMACDDQAGPSGLQSAGEERVAENVEASKIDTLSVNPPEPQPQEQLVAGTAPSTSKVVPVPSGLSSGIYCVILPSTNSRFSSETTPEKKRRLMPIAARRPLCVPSKPVPIAPKPAPIAPKPGAASGQLIIGQKPAVIISAPQIPDPTPDKMLICSVCQKEFEITEECKKHVKLHRRTFPYQCELCPSVYKFSFEILKHKMTHPILETMTCESCGYKTVWKHSFEVHKQMQCDNLKCSFCGRESQSYSQLQKHLKNHRYKCTGCRRTFMYQSQLKKHEKRHMGINDFKCDECDYKTYTLQYLKLHKKRHLDEYPFECESCGKKFRSKSSKYFHMNKHTGEFTCEPCGKSYTKQQELDLHNQRKHQDEKPFQCSVCEKHFGAEKILKQHMKMHADKRHAATFLCDVCGKALKSKESLRMHHLTHTGQRPFVCEVCGHGSTTRDSLRMHARLHTGEKPYECLVCHKHFRQLAALIIHRRYHTGECPYKCHICERAFVSNTLLKRHLQGQHGT